MSGAITNHELKKRLNNIGQKHWIQLAQKKGLLIPYIKKLKKYISIEKNMEQNLF